MRVSELSRCTVLFVFSALVMSLFAAGSLLFATDWLRGNSTPRATDAIVVLGGPPERSLYAADLYKAGYAKAVLVSRPVRESILLELAMIAFYRLGGRFESAEPRP